MKDNVSLVIAGIVVVVVLVLLPTFSVLARQDNISKNVVLTLTTKFVDSVRSKGYIGETEYNRFIQDIHNTGNQFDVKLEIYEKVYAKSGKDFVEQFMLQNNNDVFEKDGKGDISFKKQCEDGNGNAIVCKYNGENAYVLDVGDEVYVKVYNTNTTFATLVLSYIAGRIDNSKVISVDYGGQVYAKQETKYNVWPEIGTDKPTVEIAGIYNEEGKTNYREFDTGDGLVSKTVEFDVNKKVNRLIQIKIVIKNFDSILGAKGKDDIDKKMETALKENKIKLYLGEESRSLTLNIAEGSNGILSILDEKTYSVILYSDISSISGTITTGKLAYITVNEGVASYGNLMSEYTSKSFMVIKGTGNYEIN